MIWNGDPSYGNGVEKQELQMLTGSGELKSLASGMPSNWNGDPADGMGVEYGELQMLTGSGELMSHSMADGSGKEPRSYEVLSYAGGVRRVVKKKTKKKGGIIGNFRKNQKVRQNQRAADSKNNAAAIAAMKKEASKPGFKLPPMPKEKKSAGLSTAAQIGIGAGVALLLGVGIYLVVKNKKG